MRDNVSVSPQDAWVLLCSTIRYSMGRQNYMTSLAPELVLKYAEALTTRQLLQIIQEIREAIERAVNLGSTLGSEGDQETWEKGAYDMLLLVEQRRKRGIRDDD